MKSRIRIGPGAASLVLMVVILTMSVMIMLTLISARNDDQLTSRSIEVTEEYYALNGAAERRLAQLCESVSGNGGAAEAELPEGMTRAGDLVCWEETGAGRVLSCAVRPSADGEDGPYVWVNHTVTALIDREDPKAQRQELLARAAERAGQHFEALEKTVEQYMNASDSKKACLEAVRAALPEDMTMEDDRIIWYETENDQRVLACEVEINEKGSGSAIRWIRCEAVTDAD